VLFPALGFGSEPILIVLSNLGGVVVDLLINLRNKSGTPMGTGSRRRMIATVRRHFGLVSKSSPAILLNALSWQLPTIVLAVTLGPEAAGAYSLGIRTVHLPLSVLASALSTILQQRYLIANPVERAEIIGRFLHLSVRVVLPPTAAAVVAGPTLARLLLGEEWNDAGEFARYLAIGIAAWFVSSPLSFLFNVHRNHGAELRSQVVILALKLVALSGCLFSSVNTVVACALGLSMLLGYGYLLGEILSTTKYCVPWRKVFQMPLVVSAGGTSVCSMFAVYVAKYSSAACVTTIVFSVVTSWFALADTEIRSMLRK
jgi:O-antigen/teichoic acid export membrane protein